MKSIIKITLVALMGIGAYVSVNAQQINPLDDPRYGNSPTEREQNAKALSFLKGEYDMKNWDGAAGYIKGLMDSAPLAPNLYIWGTTVYRNKAARAKSLAEKKVFVDSVMLIYDRRVQYHGDDPNQGRAYILERKANDYLVLNPMDRTNVRKFYKDAVDAAGESVEAPLVLAYFQQLVTDYKGVDVSPEEFMSEYSRLGALMAGATEEEKDQFTGAFVSSGAANCEVLEQLYSKELAASPGDADILSKAYSMMSMTNCQSDFYISVAEQYYTVAPSSNIAIRLASVFEGRQEFSKALKYLNEMLASETDPAAKADLYARIAASELGLERASAAAQAARQAIALNPDNGFARRFLAESYVVGASNCSGFNRQTVYWLAYDEFSRARAAFQGDAENVARIDERMAIVRANFPPFSEIHMNVQGAQEGNPFTVSCGWISGATTIRAAK